MTENTIEQPQKPKKTRKVTDLATVKRGLKALGFGYELATTEFSNGSKVIKLTAQNTYINCTWFFNTDGDIEDLVDGE